MNRYAKTTCAAILLLSALVEAQSRYDAGATQKWREAREAELRSPTGWLTVAGLYFLKPGANTIGSDPASDVVLPGGTAPSDAGVIEYAASGDITLRLKNGTVAAVNGEPAADAIVLQAVGSEPRRPPQRVTIGTTTLQVHRSGSRVAIRLRDPKSPLLEQFKGLQWYPARQDWSVRARFIPYAQPKRIPTQNILGDNTESVSPGEVEFEVDGVTTRLVAFGEGRRLSFVFSDATSGRDTYRLRFLSADGPDAEGALTLDFNRAYNPPCAFNPYTTCPVPIPQNRLRTAITAGEKAYQATAVQTSTRAR